jgi:hypothetical protein
MATDKDKRITQINRMCDDAGCAEKIRKIHFKQYVHDNWHPHPPKDFCDWWSTQPDFHNGIDAKRAYNCQRYRDEFLESKQYGAA